jgi:hypothetical protein
MNEQDLLLSTTTETLITEIKKRHPDGCIIAMQFPEHEVRSCGQGWRIVFSGNINNTLKLANVSVWMHQAAIMNQSVPEPPEEPNV